MRRFLIAEIHLKVSKKPSELRTAVYNIVASNSNQEKI